MDTPIVQFLGPVLAVVSLSFLYLRVVIEVKRAHRQMHPHGREGK